ncbi:hypothetical protein, partial [Phenylobacterium sp.]|uniref:hypothetical protein n=1 Tax=Phenylobacterium sp. TaxID=1871053 RepID=UPI002E34938D
MIDSPPTGRGAASSNAPTVDVAAMPSVLARIARLSFRYPGRLTLTLLLTVGAAAASLTLPRLLGRSVDQAIHLVTGGGFLADAARQVLLISA